MLVDPTEDMRSFRALKVIAVGNILVCVNVSCCSMKSMASRIRIANFPYVMLHLEDLCIESSSIAIPMHLIRNMFVLVIRR